MIELKDISFGYASKPNVDHTNKTKNPDMELIHNISIKINDGEFVAIAGENGAGKSTMSKLIAGLLKPTSGIVNINEINTAKSKNSEIAKQVGFLFQNPDRQLCCYTIREEIEFGMKALKLGNTSEISERAESLIRRFNFNGDEPPFALSRGQRQRLALASIIAVEPKIMILDEPTTGLDYKECMEIMGCIRELNKNGTTVIMVCHDMELVMDFAKRMIVLAKGNLVADGKTSDIMRNTDVLKSASLLPPQIIQLAMEIETKFAKETHGEFSTVSDVSQFVDAIQKL